MGEGIGRVWQILVDAGGDPGGVRQGGGGAGSGATGDDDNAAGRRLGVDPRRQGCARHALAVPPVVAAKARVAGVEDWLAGLPELVAGLERDWAIEVGPAYGGATEALVAPATLADGTPAVLKLLVPRTDAAREEITTLRLCAGEGCVRLLRDDVERSALLLDRLGPSMYEVGLPYEQRLPILADLAARVWRPAPAAGLPTGAAKAVWLGEFITRTWVELDRPCDERAIEHALRCARTRHDAHDDARAVLVHGDVQQWNALRDGAGWALVDPDGLLAEPEYDLGVLMREDPVELLRDGPWERARWLAERTGLDPTAIWEWGVLERVSTGLLGTAVGLQPVAGQMLAAADRIAADQSRP